MKLPAGDAIVYPSSSLHRVTPVTRGARIASFFWIQSMVRDVYKRQVFHTVMDNARAASDAGTTQNIGKKQVDGIEIGFTGALAKNWSIYGLSLIHI